MGQTHQTPQGQQDPDPVISSRPILAGLMRDCFHRPRRKTLSDWLAPPRQTRTQLWQRAREADSFRSSLALEQSTSSWIPGGVRTGTGKG